MAKESKVSIQKGPLEIMPTRKTQSQEQINAEDRANSNLRRSGQVLHIMTPKQGK